MGGSFPSETLSGARLSFSLGKGDSTVTGSRGRAACPSSPQAWEQGGDLLHTPPMPALPSAAWAGARQFQGARACLSAPGALCLVLAAWVGRGWGGSALQDLSGLLLAGHASAAPCLPWSLACGDCTGQRWVSRVTEGSLRWGCGYVRHGFPACPVHGGVSGRKNRGPCTQWSPQPASRRTSRAVTVIEGVGPCVRTAQVQILPLPLPRCGILG